jgi:protein arginine kinase
MSDFPGLSESGGWFQTAGPDADVVISSRIRLSRNLAEHSFPGLMNPDDEIHIVEEVSDVFSHLKNKDEYVPLEMDSLNPIERNLLMERNLISEEYPQKKNGKVFLRKDEKVITTINDTDHLRLTGLDGGLSLEKIFNEVDILDSSLEDELDYAVSMEWGYLNTQVSNLGTGLKASVMLHLPGLVVTSLLEKAFGIINKMGLSVKGFFTEEEGSLGNIYQVSNRISLGLKEMEIIEKLNTITEQLVGYEKKAREELLEAGYLEVEDIVFRAYGLLTNSRVMSSKEAVNLLSSLRLGIALGFIDYIPLHVVTSLFFLTQKSHILHSLGISSDDFDDSMINAQRAVIIRNVLENF